MTLLKHIITLVLMLLAFGLGAKAQSTALNPYEGATHTYTWNGLSQGLDYDFYITANADGSGLLDDDLTGEFDIISKTGSVGADGKAFTDISWHNGAAANVYYFWLQATIPGGCSNQRSVKISPQYNTFDLLSENIPVSNTISCPATDVASGFNPTTASTVNNGATILQ